MRLNFKAVFAVALACLGGPALAQDSTAAPPAATQRATPAAPAANLPRRPIPYTSLRPQPRPAARAAATEPSSAPQAGAGASTTLSAAAALPVTATGARLSAGEAIPPAELEAFVDGVVRGAKARDHIAGVTDSVVQNGQVVQKKV